jgi:hypothetical protein
MCNFSCVHIIITATSLCGTPVWVKYNKKRKWQIILPGTSTHSTSVVQGIALDFYLGPGGKKYVI